MGTVAKTSTLCICTHHAANNETSVPTVTLSLPVLACLRPVIALLPHFLTAGVLVVYITSPRIPQGDEVQILPLSADEVALMELPKLFDIDSKII